MRYNTKKLIYWTVYGIFLAVGIVLSIFCVLPVKNTTTLLFGLMWFWMGVSLILKVNPHYAQKYERKDQLVISVTTIGLGVVWSVLSCTSLSDQAIPLILICVPFLIPMFLIHYHYKKKTWPHPCKIFCFPFFLLTFWLFQCMV